MSETLIERQSRSVASELVTQFSNEMEIEKTTIEIVIGLQAKLAMLSNEYGEVVVDGALQLLVDANQPISKILLFVLENPDLKDGIKKSLN
jgi:hypothetical protein